MLLGYLYLEHQNPLLLLVGVLGVVELFSRYRHRHDAAATASPRDTLPNRLILGASYFALVDLITLTMLHNPALGWGTL